MPTGDVYFERQDVPSMRAKSYIYNFNIEDPANVKLVHEGHYPSLSTDGKWLVYYRHPNELWLYNFQNAQANKIADDIDHYRPPVWISPNRLLYNSKTNQLILLDVLTEEKRVTGHEKIIPGVLSPDGKTVLCTSYDARKILLYSIDNNKIETIMESKHLSIGSTFTWRPDGKSFFFGRQTWSKMFQLLEVNEFFLFSLEDKIEKHLSSDRCFLGVFIGDRFNKK
jgi:tricorn protease-like protein